jgi:hypothetical protein
MLEFRGQREPTNTKQRRFKLRRDYGKKSRQTFDILNSQFSELYVPTEHVAMDEVIVKFKGKSPFVSKF